MTNGRFMVALSGNFLLRVLLRGLVKCAQARRQVEPSAADEIEAASCHGAELLETMISCNLRYGASPHCTEESLESIAQAL